MYNIKQLGTVKSTMVSAVVKTAAEAWLVLLCIQQISESNHKHHSWKAKVKINPIDNYIVPLSVSHAVILEYLNSFC